MQMTYTLSPDMKASLTLAGRKAANKALWASEKSDRLTLKAYTDKKARKATKVAKKADKLKRASIEAVYASVSQTHSRGEALLPTKPLDSKVQSVTTQRLKRKARKGPKDSAGKLEAQAQAQSLRQAQARAAKAVKTEVVEDITGKRTEVEVTPKNPAKAHVIRKAWVDMPTDMSVEDAFRYATMQDGYGCFEDEVSLDDCM
jgi:plasmid replication initiation protein